MTVSNDSGVGRNVVFGFHMGVSLKRQEIQQDNGYC